VKGLERSNLNVEFIIKTPHDINKPTNKHIPPPPLLMATTSDPLRYCRREEVIRIKYQVLLHDGEEASKPLPVLLSKKPKKSRFARFI
jgi:hypothetical protein